MAYRPVADGLVPGRTSNPLVCIISLVICAALTAMMHAEQAVLVYDHHSRICMTSRRAYGGRQGNPALITVVMAMQSWFRTCSGHG